MKAVPRQQLELFNYEQDAPPEPGLNPPPRPKPSGLDPDLTRLSRELLDEIKLPLLSAQVTVVWNSRLRTTAGRAYCSTQRVELNPALVDVSEAEIDRTLRHELAHLVAYHRARGRRIEPHGYEWKQACVDLGIPDEDRCHDLPFERTRQKRKFAYSCPSCGHVLERVRRIRKPAACYECCRTYNGGRYDSKYELLESRLKN